MVVDPALNFRARAVCMDRAVDRASAFRATRQSGLPADVKSEYCHTILNRVRAGNWAKFACEFNADRKQTCRRSRGM
jgi:hypothetical protein